MKTKSTVIALAGLLTAFAAPVASAQDIGARLDAASNIAFVVGAELDRAGGWYERVAEAAGFNENRANTLLAENGMLTGKVKEPVLGREAKVAALHEISAKLGITPEDAMAVEESPELVEEGLVKRRRTADGQGQPVGDEGVALRERSKLLAEPAANADPVFRGDLEETDLRGRGLRQRTQNGWPGSCP